MSEEHYDIVKEAVLNHLREVFEEIEVDIARTHEEKYAMLEDVLENAGDVDELKVAFTQWYNDQADDLELEYELEELWQNSLGDVDLS
ncbi:hypothetical protein HOF40_00800 [Candidatus Parcubacteria bacterium]|jgi:hemoglobin-like flavoprotein|nr:hypothetical protein [Candidatus Parcubacteria bacterium]MBT3948609.1 hypothetical protein [Candidatus Parcubacteria bacterium]